MSAEAAPLQLALDVGTRKVLALAGRLVPEGLEIVGAATREHRARPMRDGQVQAVAEVGRAVREVLDDLASQGLPSFRSASVAVAGRELKVFRATAKRRRQGGSPVTAEEAARLERRAYEEAARRMEEDRARMDKPAGYFGVGYDVVSRRVDGAAVDSLLGFTGAELAVECLVAFLPASSLDGLAGVMEAVGLDISCLTLEPIAALEAAVPSTLRHLNLALVDVGAGTSDFAVVRRGAVAGYGMIPYAGDELTERIGDHFLVDFQAAEALKRAPAGGEGVEFEDLLGRARRSGAAEREAVLGPHLDALAAAIARKVESLNGGSPRALLLVGGAGQTPGLSARIARALSMREEDVGLLYPGKSAGLIDRTGKVRGPETATALGILRLGCEARGLGLFPAEVNGRRLRVVHVGGAVSVADALAAAGFSRDGLESRGSEILRVVVEGREKSLELRRAGNPAILVNGKPAAPGTALSRGDQIQFDQGEGAESHLPRVKDLLGEPSELRYTLNGQAGVLKERFLVHGEACAPETPVRDGDILAREEGPTVGRALAAAGLTYLDGPGDTWRARVNGVERQKPWEAWLRLNGQPCGASARLQDGDVLEASAKLPRPRVRDLMEDKPRQGRALRVSVNGKFVTLPGEAPRITMNGRPAQMDDEVPPEADILVLGGKDAAATVGDLFAAKTLGLPRPQPGAALIRVNGREAGFASALADGDRVEVLPQFTQPRG